MQKHDFLAVFCLDLLNIGHDESENFYLEVIANVFVTSDFYITYFFYTSLLKQRVSLLMLTSQKLS